MINFIFIGLGSQVTTSLLSSQKMTKINLYSTLLYMVIGIPMGLMLIPRFGVIGYQAILEYLEKKSRKKSDWRTSAKQALQQIS